MLDGFPLFPGYRRKLEAVGVKGAPPAPTVTVAVPAPKYA
jgi:hypothetical protein